MASQLIPVGIGTPSTVAGFILAGMSPVQPVAAATYYIDFDGGSDAANGLTPATAWKTVDKVSTTTKLPGDAYLFKRGQVHRGLLYTVESGTIGLPITFGAYGTGDRPIMTLATLLSSGWSDIGSNRWTHAVTTDPTQVFFDSVRGTVQVSQAAVNAPLEWFWAANVLTVYSTSDPATAFTNPGIEEDGGGSYGAVAAFGLNYLACDGLHASKSRYGFWLGGAGNHNSLTDCEGSLCYYDGASWLAGNTYGSATNCTMHDNAHNGLSFAVDADNGTVTGGTFYNNAPDSDAMFAGGIGVSVYQSTDIVVVGTTAYDNTYGLKTFDALTERVTFSNNICYDNSLFGIDVDTSGAGIIVEFNNVHDNGTHQIAVEVTATGCIVRYNYVHDGPAGAGLSGIEVLGTDDVEVYYNLLWNLENGIALYSDPAGTALYNNTIANITTAPVNASFDNASIADITMKNNVGDGSLATRVVDCGVYTISGLVSDYNDWYAGGGDKMVYNNLALSLAGWQAATGQDAHSINSNPVFYSLPFEDFQLSTNSPCLNAGVDVGLTHDIVGAPVIGAPDQGAYESQVIGGSGQFNPALTLWPRRF